jgi:energy-converting hydrogenase Eha subunit E
MGFLKFCAVAACIIIGAAFLATGLGASIPYVKYKEIEILNLPIGVVFLGLGYLLSRYWVVSETTRRIHRESYTDPVTGSTRTKVDTLEITTKAAPPSDA